MKRSRVPVAAPQCFPLYMELVEDVRYIEIPRHLDWGDRLAWRCTHRAAARAWPRLVRDVPVVCGDAELEELEYLGAAPYVTRLRLAYGTFCPWSRFPSVHHLLTRNWREWPLRLTRLEIDIGEVLTHKWPFPPTLERLKLTEFNCYYWLPGITCREICLPASLRRLTCSTGQLTLYGAGPVVPIALRFAAPAALERLTLNTTQGLLALPPEQAAALTGLQRLVIHGRWYPADSPLPPNVVEVRQFHKVTLCPAQLAPLVHLRTLVLSGDLDRFIDPHVLLALPQLTHMAWARITDAGKRLDRANRAPRRWRSDRAPQKIKGIDCYYIRV